MWRPDRREALGEEDVRSLEMLDLILAGAPRVELGVDGDALARLVSAVRAEHPPLRADFADELGLRVRGGFGRPDGGGRRRGLPASALSVRGAATRRSWGTRGQRLVGLGAAASLAVGAAVVGGGLVSGSSPGVAPRTSSPATSGSSGGAMAAPPKDAATAGQDAATAPTGTAAVPQSPGGGVYRLPNGQLAYRPVPAASAPATARAVESDASLALVAPRGRVQQVTDAAIAATDRLGGIVESSNVTVADQGGSQATLALEVPSGALDRTLAAISALAHVSSRSQDTQDITDPTSAARQRLAESRDERTALLRQLGRASTPNQVASIRGQLGLVDGRIAKDEASLQTLVGHASMASLSVTIDEAGRAGAVDGGGNGSPGSPWRPEHALRAALGVLEAVFAVLVVGLAGLIPAAAVAVLLWWVGQAVLRRRRQGALARVG